MNQLVDGIICLIAQLTSPSQNDQTASACVHDPIPETGIIPGLWQWLIIHNLPVHPSFQFVNAQAGAACPDKGKHSRGEV